MMAQNRKNRINLDAQPQENNAVAIASVSIDAKPKGKSNAVFWPLFLIAVAALGYIFYLYAEKRTLEQEIHSLKNREKVARFEQTKNRFGDLEITLFPEDTEIYLNGKKQVSGKSISMSDVNLQNMLHFQFKRAGYHPHTLEIGSCNWKPVPGKEEQYSFTRSIYLAPIIADKVKKQ